MWPGWSGRVPFGVLLVAGDFEYLVNYGDPPAEFELDRPSALLAQAVWRRPRHFSRRVTAALPAFGGDSVIAIGQPEAIGRCCTSWVLTALHEHFHQFQHSRPGYTEAVHRLGLSGGDETGMWMLNYPFPYDNAALKLPLARLCERLASAVEGTDPFDGSDEAWNSYEAFLSRLPEPARRYMCFQLWQEGVARYAELRVADVASACYEASAEFAALPDAEPFAAAASRLRGELVRQLRAVDLGFSGESPSTASAPVWSCCWIVAIRDGRRATSRTGSRWSACLRCPDGARSACRVAANSALDSDGD